MLDNIKVLFFKNRVNVILILSLLVLAGGGFFAYNQYQTSKSSEKVDEVDLSFDPEGPYALLAPRRDGNALILNLKRTSSYDKISYELAYVSKPDSTSSAKSTDEGGDFGGVDRGVIGDVNTKEKKGEYEQEILFGTCSKNVCKYDKGVENGTLTLHIRKGSQAFRMITQWRIQQIDVSLGNLISGDGHFNYKITASRQDLSTVGFSIINDVTGVPKLPEGRQVLGKVYALNVPLAKNLMSGDVKIEAAMAPDSSAKIARFDNSQSKWIEFDTKINGSNLTASADGSGIFAVLVNKK